MEETSSPLNLRESQKTKRYIILISISIIIFFTFISLYLYFDNDRTDKSDSKIINEFADWNTYVSSEYGIKFKYPSSLDLSEAWVFDEIRLNNNIEDYQVPFIVIKFINRDPLTNYQEASVRLKNLGEVGSKEILISNNKAFDLYKKTPESSNIVEYPPNLPIGFEDHEIYLDNRGSGTIFIKSTNLDPLYLSKILSTFTFVPTSTPLFKTDSWNIYTNQKYGFEFRYPSDYKIVDQIDTNKTIKIINEHKSDIDKNIKIPYQVFISIGSDSLQTNEKLNMWIDKSLSGIKGRTAFKSHPNGETQIYASFGDTGECQFINSECNKDDKLRIDKTFDSIFKYFEFK